MTYVTNESPQPERKSNKAVLSNKIYLHAPEGSKLAEDLASELTYEIMMRPGQPPKVFRHALRVNANIMAIPYGRVDLIPEDYELVDKTVTVPVDIPKPTFILRGTQEEYVNLCEGTGILAAKPGWGKSIATLGLAYKLQQKTLVICTNTNIRDMWIREVKKWFGFEPGIIGSSKFNTKPPIVIANIQSLTKHNIALQTTFGLVVTDEAHHCPASTFKKFLDLSKAKYKVGLSGTTTRKDGLHVMFEDFFGKFRFDPPVENTLLPVVHLYQTDIEFSSNAMIPWATRVNDLKAKPEYVKFIAGLCAGYKEAGHKVLLVSDRTAFLEEIASIVEGTYLITGKAASLTEREAIMEEVAKGPPCVLAATQSIFAEGISLNELSCLILGTPLNNPALLEQLAGRVMRLADGKLDPVLVDIELKGGTTKNQRQGRLKVYSDKGWNTEKYSLEKLISDLKSK